MTDHDDAVPAEAREIVVGDAPETWARLGFAIGDDGAIALAGVRVMPAGDGPLRMNAAGLAAESPDGLPIVSAPDPSPVAAAAHPNGALAVDHVVALTDAMPRTLGALEAAGFELRGGIGPAMAFLRFGPLILEVVETGEGPPRLWGLVVVVSDLDAAAERLGALLGEPRDAVQPGRRIATVRREAGLSARLALMTPRP